jgi:hypothetical protein
MTAYEMCVKNCALAIKRNNQLVNAGKWTDEQPPANAFDMALGLAVGFCKNAEEVCIDIINAGSSDK